MAGLLVLATVPSAGAQERGGAGRPAPRGAARAQRNEAAEPPLRGFAPPHATSQRQWEEKLLQIPTAQAAEAHLRFLTAEPHLAGTPGSRRVAEYVRDQLQSFGFEAELVRYDVWLPHPKEVTLELVAPERMSLARPEEPVEGDPSSSDSRAVMGYNGYSPSGDVTAPVVYANYGLPEDYQRLRERGVSVEGKIVLVRYGRTFRGVKTYVAEENKAAGVIIFSDPADDGFVAGDPYPRGPWRPMSGIQRGSVYYGFLTPGDPLTPGVAAQEGATRLRPEEARTLPRIPTMPISARDAAEILRRLNGPRVPRSWQGGLPFTYHLGAAGVRVHLKLEMDYQRRAIWDAVGTLRGANPNEWVIVGNHHDAWVFGAVDPSSGTATVLETARALGALVKAGWKPRRTILVCAWDAEEFGLIGSTEWVEQRMEELQRKAVAYINVDSAVSGDRFGASATPSLKPLVRDAAREVADPRTGRSVYDVWRERSSRRDENSPAPPGADQEERLAPVGNLGSGSDFTPFFHHAGVPSLDVGFGGEYGVYHSIYDSFTWMKKFGDPDFAYHAAAARLAGVLVLRLTEADVLPFDYEAYSREIDHFVDDLQRVAHQSAGAAANLDLKPVAAAAADFRGAAARVMTAARAAASDVNSPRAARINAALRQVEGALLAPRGLAGRPWYRHTIFAPGTYEGYGVVLLPGVREALERGDWPTAQSEAVSLAEALRRAASVLARAANASE